MERAPVFDVADPLLTQRWVSGRDALLDALTLVTNKMAALAGEEHGDERYD